MVTPYLCCRNSDSDLSTTTVISILKESEKNKSLSCHLPPLNPKGGEVYLFLPQDINAKGTVWVSN